MNGQDVVLATIFSKWILFYEDVFMLIQTYMYQDRGYVIVRSGEDAGYVILLYKVIYSHEKIKQEQLKNPESKCHNFDSTQAETLRHFGYDALV